MAQQLELFSISNAQIEANRLIRLSQRLMDAVDGFKIHTDHTKQLPLFPVGNYQMWQLMVDRESI